MFDELLIQALMIQIYGMSFRNSKDFQKNPLSTK